MGTPDDFNFEIGQDSGESFLENRSLIATVCKEFFQERIHAEQGRQKQDTAVAILDIGRMNDGVKQQTQRVYENMAFLALDFLACIIAMRIDAGPPCMGTSMSRTKCATSTSFFRRLRVVMSKVSIHRFPW
jgi:hypothetical protein